MEVYIFSIRRANRRQYMCKGALLSREVPFEKIKVFNGPDNKDFETLQDLYDHAAKNGFPELEILGENRSIASAAQMYGYLKLFKQVSDIGVPVFFLHDDAYLKERYSYYERIMNTLVRWKDRNQDAPKPMYYVNACTNRGVGNWEVDKNFSSLGIFKGVPVGSNDFAGIIFPDFYNWFVSRYFNEERMHVHLDTFFWEHADLNEDGFYSIPLECGADRFPLEFVGSMMHKTQQILEKDEWMPQRIV